MDEQICVNSYPIFILHTYNAGKSRHSLHNQEKYSNFMAETSRKTAYDHEEIQLDAMHSVLVLCP